MAKRAFGRSLSDFPDLSEAEFKLIAYTARGEMCFLGDGELPTKPSTERNIRAGLIRFLALGGDNETPVHEKGVQLFGGWIGDGIDLEAAVLPVGLWLLACNFCQPIILQGAKGTIINLTFSKIVGVEANFLKLSASLFLREVISTKEIRLASAQISGDLYFSAGSFLNPKNTAFDCQSITVDGALHFKETKVEGLANFDGAKIGMLFDEEASWPNGQCVFDGLQYDSIHVNAPTNSKSRVAWLKKQLVVEILNIFAH